MKKLQFGLYISDYVLHKEISNKIIEGVLLTHILYYILIIIYVLTDLSNEVSSQKESLFPKGA